jgi:oligoribonuclease NrnB/cAMP/cGMP phosphodiesterase (DHH superfamily)
MIYLIYHNNCFDGFMAAYSAWLKLRPRTDLKFIGANYNEKFPISDTDLINSEVYIMDFSFPKDVLEKVHGIAKKVLVLDHHDTAEKQLTGLDFAIFDQTKSGAMLAWEYFHPGTPAPRLIQYVQDRDLWKFKLPSSKEINAVIQSYNIGSIQDFEIFSQISTKMENDKILEVIIQEGAAILRSVDQVTNLAIKRSLRFVELCGYTIPVVNSSIFESEICAKLNRLYPDSPFSATYYDLKNGEEQAWSLRSLPGGFDVSQIALQFGGGGHKNASGFKKKTNV